MGPRPGLALPGAARPLALLLGAGSRRADIAMRRALGAARGRLLRTFLAVPNQDDDAQGYFDRVRAKNDRINEEINGNASY